MSEPKRVEDMTLSELQDLKAKFMLMPPEEITPEQRQGLVQLDGLIMNRMVSDQLKQIRQTETFVQTSKESDEKAKRLWPELNDPDSAFAKEVEEYVKALGPDAENDPRALLNAANAVGVERGESPAGSRPKDPKPTAVKGGDSDEPEDADDSVNAFVQKNADLLKKYRDVVDTKDPKTLERLAQYRAEGED